VTSKSLVYLHSCDILKNHKLFEMFIFSQSNCSFFLSWSTK